MRATPAFVVLAFSALAATGIAQTGGPDFSGRWRLVQPTAAQLAQETLTVTAPDELLVKQTRREITIEHPSQPGTHPEAGTSEYGSLEAPHRLVIEFGEERAGERPAIAARTYMKVTPH